VGSIYNETTLLVGPTNLSTAQDMGFEVQDQIHPAADSDGTNYAVVWSEQYLGSATDYDIYMCTVDKNGKVADPHDNLDFSTAHSDDPQITSAYSGGGPKTQYNSVWDSDAAGGTILAGTYDKSPFTSFCFPAPGNFWDSAAACPCGNPPSSVGRGCNNSAGTGGALLTSTGVASLSGDTVMFTSSGEKPSAFSLFAQGTTPLFGGVIFGQGIRCVGGTLKRLYTHSASGGVVSGGFGVGSDLQVHVRSASPPGPIDVINAGEARYYFVYYRDPTVLGGCPATATFNATQSGSLVWYP
jgi:hypothetical protein